MKPSPKYHFTLVILLIAFQYSSAQKASSKGYTIEGDILTFIFDVNDYPNIKYNGNTIDKVYVAGEFNNWATDQWQLTKINDTRYELKKGLYEFTSDYDWEFKFVVNGIHWAEPSPEFENITDAKTIYGKPLAVYNLKLYSAFATKDGNITFRLKGYNNARKVILSGTFNRWDTNGFIMNKVKNGWQITLQLRPDVYQYKFIVDGAWIEDPSNPSKVINEFNGYNSVVDVQTLVLFQLCDYKDADTVILSGNFNHWSHNDYKMTKVNDCWVYNVKLSGGKYHYKYIVDNKWILDPYNSVKEYDTKGHINSVCMVK